VNKKEIDVLRNSHGIAASDYSDELCRLICSAARSSNLEANQKAWLLVQDGLGNFIAKDIMRYGHVSPGDTRFDDCESEIFITIMENLRKWDPKKGKLTTFFNPYFEKCLLEMRVKEETFTSSYYSAVYWDIGKARVALEARGIKNPTVREVKDVLELEFNIFRSERTLRETLAQEVDVQSLEGIVEWSGPAAERVLSKGTPVGIRHGNTEDDQRVRSAVGKMELYNEILTDILIEFYDGDRRDVTNEKIRNEFNIRTGENWSVADVVARRRSIKRDLKRCLPKKDKKPVKGLDVGGGVIAYC